MKTIKKTLSAAGLEEQESQKKLTRYKVLHIPTASCLCSFNSKTKQFELAIFSGKAKAGHGRDDYRLQRFTSRSYDGQGLYLEDDIATLLRSGQKIDSFYASGRLRNLVTQRTKDHGHPYHKDEFELLPLEEDNADSTTLESESNIAKK